MSNIGIFFKLCTEVSIVKKISKIFIFLAFLFFLSGNNIWAQFGLKAGATLSLSDNKSVIYNASSLFTAKAGFHFSLVIAGSQSISLQPGLNFAMKGGRYYSVHQRAYSPVHLNYIEIPILFSIRLLREKFDLYLGPYVGFLISSTKIVIEDNWTSMGNKIKNNDIGISLGSRCYIIRRVFVEIQFNYGLTKVVYDPNPLPQAFDRFHKNKTLSLLVGFNI